MPNQFRQALAPALLLLSFLIIAAEILIGEGGVIDVKPGEVAVVINNTGLGIFGTEHRVIIDQGAKTFIPGFQSIHILERRPQVLVMAKKSEARRREDNRATVTKNLTVRAYDGSNFYFDRLEIHYQIIPSEAAVVLSNIGPYSEFKEDIVEAHAREILRDEFGRYSFLEVANPATYTTATTEAKKRINDRLGPYGLEVTQIVTPKPKFENRVEKAIEDRQNAEQEVEVQEEKRRKLEQEKGLKLQSIEQSKNAEYQALIAELEAKKKAASNKLIRQKREADKYYIGKQASGEAYSAEKLLRAKANEIAYTKKAEALSAKITALGASGTDVLNRVIAENIFPQLKQVSATPRIQPVSPIDIRHIDSNK